MKNVVVIAGGDWQAPIIKYLKSKNHVVHVVNPVVNNTTALADFHIKEDIRNFPDLKEILKEVKPEFITSDQSDVAMMPVARLSQELGTRSNSVKSIELFTNKIKMVEFASKFMPIPRSKQVKTEREIIDFWWENKPLILKPADANASRGLLKIDDLVGLPSKFKYTLSHSKLCQAIAQEYVKGTSIILDGICSNRKHRTLATARKDHFREAVISQVSYPSKIESSLLEEIIKVNDEFVENSELEFGITHAEYIVDENTGKFWFIEIAARGGGFKISSDIVPWVSGVNLYDILYKDLTGTTTNVKMLNILNRPALMQFYEYPSGQVEKIEVKDIPFVNEFRIFVKEGDNIKPAKDGGCRHAVAIILEETEEKILDVEKEIREKVRVKIK
jgi:carbamoyl-phosphate synthase large subunit